MAQRPLQQSPLIYRKGIQMTHRDPQGRRGGYGDDQHHWQDDEQRQGFGAPYGDNPGRSQQQGDAYSGGARNQEARHFGGPAQQSGYGSGPQGRYEGGYGTSSQQQGGPSAWHRGDPEADARYGQQPYRQESGYRGPQMPPYEQPGPQRYQGQGSSGSAGWQGEWQDRESRIPEPQGAGYARHQGYQSGPGGHGSGYDNQFDPDYHQWRTEQLRSLDNDYHSWRQDRYKKFSDEFNSWRNSRQQQTSGGETPSRSGASSVSGSDEASSGSSPAQAPSSQGKASK